jgi:hypothetical protein
MRVAVRVYMVVRCYLRVDAWLAFIRLRRQRAQARLVRLRADGLRSELGRAS